MCRIELTKARRGRRAGMKYIRWDTAKALTFAVIAISPLLYRELHGRRAA